MRHVEKPESISQEDWDSVDVPEATDEEFERAIPFAQAFPYQAQDLMVQDGRPKVKVAWRLAADVVDAIRASGKGYNARVEAILRDALAKGLI